MLSSQSGTIVPLLQTVFTSILEVFLLCLAGYILAGRGILDKKTQKQLNRLNVSLFTPSLLFSKVAFFLSPAKLRELWIIPIFFVLVTLVSMAVSFLLGFMFRLKKSQRSFAMAAAMFMNSNSLPIALMQSLVVTVPGLKWGSDDNKDAMVGRALTYLVLYSTLGMVVRWSYGVRLLAHADDEPEAIRATAEIDDERSALLASYEDEEHHFHAGSPPLQEDQLISTTTHVTEEHPDGVVPNIVVHKASLRPPTRRQSTFYRSFPNSPNESRANLPAIVSENPSSSVSVAASQPSSDDEDEDELPTHEPHRSHHHKSGLRSVLRRTGRQISRSWTLLNEFMTVPLWAALASLFVACIRPVQHALEAHMTPVKSALSAAGDCSIPLTLIVLGAYFYPPPKEESERGRGLVSTKSSNSLLNSVKEMFSRSPRRGSSHTTSTQQVEKRPGETKTVVISVVSRMIITPLLLLPLMALSTKFDLQAVFDDPVFVVANVLLISSPPALTLAQITQAAASGDAFERLISRTIFWAYCVVTPPATIIYVVIGLYLAKL